MRELEPCPHVHAPDDGDPWSDFGLEITGNRRPLFVVGEAIVTFDRQFYEGSGHWLEWFLDGEDCEGSC